MFRTLLEAGVVDTVEPAVVPVLLGEGIPMLPPPGLRTKLALTSHRVYSKSGHRAARVRCQSGDRFPLPASRFELEPEPEVRGPEAEAGSVRPFQASGSSNPNRSAMR